MTAPSRKLSRHDDRYHSLVARLLGGGVPARLMQRLVHYWVRPGSPASARWPGHRPRSVRQTMAVDGRPIELQDGAFAACPRTNCTCNHTVNMTSIDPAAVAPSEGC